MSSSNVCGLIKMQTCHKFLFNNLFHAFIFHQTIVNWHRFFFYNEHNDMHKSRVDGMFENSDVELRNRPDERGIVTLDAEVYVRN